tara:strand:+ start:272 stop:2743 length:2472 start_codon:yes stop_codon:yes gene_type:complete
MLGLISISLTLLSVLGLIGGLLALGQHGRLRQLETRVRELEQGLSTPRPAGEQGAQAAAPTTPPDEVPAAEPAATRPMPASAPARRVQRALPVVERDGMAQGPTQASVEAPVANGPPSPPPARGARSSAASSSAAMPQVNWMVWLGGLCVGLAGIFLVRYGIESGFLGPWSRVALGVLTGLALHALAEKLRRRSGSSQPAWAALAGGASITLYAAVLAALRMYDLLTPAPAFLLLALIALATMWLSLYHGPVLAILGLLGAYAVPLLVSSGGGEMLIPLVYSLIISAAALLLMRYQSRIWLWGGVLAGALGWWLLSLSDPTAGMARALYLAALAYGAVALPSGDWWLRGSGKAPAPISVRRRTIGNSSDEFALWLLAAAMTLSILVADSAFRFNPVWAALTCVAILITRARTDLSYYPWVVLVAHCAGLLVGSLEWEAGALQMPTAPESARQVMLLAAGMAAVYSGLGWLTARGHAALRARESLIALAPVLWLAVTYLLVTGLAVDWRWSLASLALAALYSYFASRALLHKSAEQALWFILASQLALSMALVMLLREATLTLAIATQLVALAWSIRRFQLTELDWLLKLVLAVVLLRLTLNPWLLQYPEDVHWSLWTYGGSTLCSYLALRLTSPDSSLRPWLAVASAQLLVLFLAAELRYWLYDGAIFASRYTLTEAAINSSLWAALGLGYRARAQVAQSLAGLYRMLASALLGLAAVNQLALILPLNPLWSGYHVGATPFLNLISLAYGLPALLALLALREGSLEARRVAGTLGAVSALLFVSLHIRHLWQPVDIDLRLPTSDGELYSYSAVWLVLAVVAIL